MSKGHLFHKGGIMMLHRTSIISASILLSILFFHAPIVSKAKWTVVIYMAAANDLAPFADRNIEQMKLVGSNENLTILIHLDTAQKGMRKLTRRFIVQKNKLVQLGPDMAMDSGSAQTLISTIRWADVDFPADHLAVVFWNHGSGDLNPLVGRSLNPARLFMYNPKTNMVELDRSVGFMHYLDTILEPDQRGICFDETTQNYLNDQRLKHGLEVCYKERGNKKIDLIYFDACLMSGMGTAWIVQQFADYMVASEEVVLGTGANYALVLAPLRTYDISPREFAHHIVKCYDQIYSKITQDYTHSAIDLANFDELVIKIDTIAQLLIKAIDHQKNNTVRIAIKQSLGKFACTQFDEPSYRDCYHFLQNIFNNSAAMQVDDITIINALRKEITECLEIIKRLVIANVAGRNLKGAQGISIYCPDRAPLHPSYQHTEFAQYHQAWLQFLLKLLQ